MHRWLARRVKPRSLSGSAGHDAAVLRATSGRDVVCVDQTVSGVHFDARASARDVGRKAVGRALSDLAATAATPRAVLCALCAPPETDERWLKALLASVRERAERFGADLVAGDLCAARGPLFVSITALGEISARGTPPGRDRARVGQHVVLTGPVGGSFFGRHLAIEPRLAEGRWLHARGATAMMDVSDGLAWDLFRMARASRVRIELDLDRVPIHRDAHRRARTSRRTALWHALHDGEDHELLATCSARVLARLTRESREHSPRLQAIGRVRTGRGLVLIQQGHAPRLWRHAEGGFEHGR